MSLKSLNPHQLKYGKKYMIKHDVSGKIYRGTFAFMTSIMVIMKDGDTKSSSCTGIISMI